MSFFHSNILFIIMIINQTYQFYCKQYPIFPSQGLQSTSSSTRKEGECGSNSWLVYPQSSIMSSSTVLSLSLAICNSDLAYFKFKDFLL